MLGMRRLHDAAVRSRAGRCVSIHLVSTPVLARRVTGIRRPQQHRSLCQAAKDQEQAEKTVLDLPFESDSSSSPTPTGNGSRTIDRAMLAPGTLVHDRYTIQEALGAGSNAITYRALDSTTNKPVALKALSLKALRDWKQLELFQREAKVLQGLSHPGIPRYLEYFEEDTESDRAFYIVQEVAVGKSLAEVIASGMRADETEVLRIATDLLDILKYLGSLRPPVIHRDIKPENVILEGGSWGGRVYLVDFGGVQGVTGAGDQFALGSTIVGTYGFMAPEQFRGAATPSSDLYSLGATLLYLVSGRPPGAFPQKRMRLVYEDKVSTGPQLKELLDGLLEPQVEDRLTVQEAVDVATGRAAVKRKRAAKLEKRRQQQQNTPGDGGSLVRMPDGSVYSVADPMPTRPVKKPAGSRVQLSNTSGRLDIEIPPQGLSGANIGTGLFAVAWNAFVAFWTVSALAGGGILFALFSAPFWYAGVQLAGQALGGALLRERFAIGRQNFRIAQELATLSDGTAKFLGANARHQEGDVEDLTGARIVTTMIVNGVPRTAIEIVEGVNRYKFGEALELNEQQWLVWEINQHLKEARGRAPALADMPYTDAPEVVDDGDIGVSAGSRVDPFWDLRDQDSDSDPFSKADDSWKK